MTEAHVMQVTSPSEATSLAEHLLDPARTKPVVVVTVPSGRTSPYIDVQQIADEVSDLADVYLMPTGSASWSLAAALPDKTQVYGGAGRVYATDAAWQTDPYASALRFAHSGGDGTRVSRDLIADALRAAQSAGLVTARGRRRLPGGVPDGRRGAGSGWVCCCRPG